MRTKGPDDKEIFGEIPREVAEEERVKLDFAVALEQLRRARKLSYREVARLYKRSPGYISRIFRGDENVTVGTMVRLAHVLGGTVEVKVVDATARKVVDLRHNVVTTMHRVYQEAGNVPLTVAWAGGREAWKHAKSPEQALREAILGVSGETVEPLNIRTIPHSRPQPDIAFGSNLRSLHWEPRK